MENFVDNLYREDVTEKIKPVMSKVDGLYEYFLVHSYTGSTKNNNLICMGEGYAKCYSEKEGNLPKVQKLITIKDLKDINRQKRQDKGNKLRTRSEGKTFVEAMEESADHAPFLRPLLDQVKSEYASGKLTEARMKAYQSKLASITI